MSPKYQKIYNITMMMMMVYVCVCVGGEGDYGRHTALTPAAVKIKLVVNDDSLEARNTSKKRKDSFIESVYVQ